MQVVTCQLDQCQECTKASNFKNYVNMFQEKNKIHHWGNILILQNVKEGRKSEGSTLNAKKVAVREQQKQYT